MFTTSRIADHPYAQAFIRRYTNGAIDFISYRTTVIQITADGWLKCHGTYSQTTRKQIGWFLRECGNGFGYHTAKQLYTDRMELNIYTGEVRPL